MKGESDFTIVLKGRIIAYYLNRAKEEERTCQSLRVELLLII